MASCDDEDNLRNRWSVANEGERLTINHYVTRSAMGEQLVFAPIDLNKPGLCILDSATADGLWMRDLQSSLKVPQTWIGTDIKPNNFPKHPSPNMSYYEQNITAAWPREWSDRFDLVHQRHVLASSRDHPRRDCVLALVDLVKPGGWIQIVELDLTPHDSAGLVLRDCLKLLRELARFPEYGGSFARGISGWFREAGLEGVDEKFVDLPVGVSNPDPELADRSIRGFVPMMSVVCGLASDFRVSFTTEELDSMVPRLLKEFKSIGGINRLVVAWGRKAIR